MSNSAYQLHKPIRNRIRKFDREALLEKVNKQNIEAELNYQKNGKFLPWHGMLIIQWIIQYGSSGGKVPTQNDVGRLYNDLLRLNDELSRQILIEDNNIEKYIRRLILQQTLYQENIHDFLNRNERLRIIYRKIDHRSGIQDNFYHRFGITIDNFFLISAFIYGLAFLGHHNKQVFTKLEKFFDKDWFKKYLSISSATVEELKIILDSSLNSKRFYLVLYQDSQLYKRPILRRNNNYELYSLAAYSKFVESFVYEYLLETENFHVFGELFEDYVSDVLASNGNLIFLREKDWKKFFSNNDASYPDFTIIEDKGTIFLEAKSKPLNLIARVVQSNKALSNNLDDSIVKGFEQIYELASKVLEDRPQEVKNFENLFGIVVEYKKSYLQGGRRLWDEFLCEEIEAKLQKKSISASIIKPENLFIFSIEEIEILNDFLLQNAELTFCEVLSSIAKLESDPMTSSINLHLHLKTLSDGKFYKSRHLEEAVVSTIEVEIPEFLNSCG